MRAVYVILGMGLVIPLLLGSTCLTIDPPPPPRLSAPSFTGHTIIPKMYDDEMMEVIHITWRADTTDTISVSSFTLIAQTAQDSSPMLLIIKNIPPDTNSLDYIVADLKFGFDDRAKEQPVECQIFAIDSLGRSGDTSMVYTVEIARLVDLLIPSSKDTLDTNLFSWEIPQVFNPTVSLVMIWSSDSLIWIDSLKYIGPEIICSKSLPSPQYPLPSGSYFWGVEFSITNITEPKSITINKFYVR